MPPPRGKRAFLCAVTYKKQKCQLKGTIQDVKNMKDLLIEVFNFPAESILILAEEEGYGSPTRTNIEDAMQWLVKGIQPGDSLLFYFSGHGLRKRDFNGDEIDGFDETICPVDFQINGMILDNYINKTIVGPLTPGVTLHAIIDSCHSGTILDLPYVYNISTGEWEDNSPPSGAYKGTNGGRAISFSACEDYQQAADTSPGEMATRRVSCRWCGVAFAVPPGAQTLPCPSCRRPLVLQNNNNGYLPSQGRGNGYPMFNPTNMSAPARPPYPPQIMGRLQVPVPPQLYAPPAHGRKRAVLVGINYRGHEQSLDGSINDVLLMRKLLVQRFGFPNASIVLLTEEEDFSHIPTKKNIRSALRWLVHGCQPGDSLMFHYSGHGSQVRDQDGDELDGMDEALLPLDYQTEGRILDDEINATIVRPLPNGATLHSVVDTCYSGTFLDLPNVCRINRQGYYKWEDHGFSQEAYKGTSGGHAICISACDDHENAGDTTAFTGTATGALTFSFVQTLEREARLTYGNLLIIMRKRIAAARQQVGYNIQQSPEEPVLSSSHKFDIYSKPITL